MTTSTWQFRCPHCRAEHEFATDLGPEGRAPRAEDIGMCFRCGLWLVFTDDGARKPTVDETGEIMGNKAAMDAQRAWLALQMERRRGEPVQ